MKSVVSAVLILAFVGCGDSRGGGSLLVEIAGGEEVIPASLLFRNRDSVAFATVGDGVALVWQGAVGNDRSAIYGQFLDANLEATVAKTMLSGTEPRRRIQPALCPSAGPLAVAWSEILPNDLYPIGVNLDTGNTMATFSWEDGVAPIIPARVNPNVIGRQIDPSVACLANGDRAVTWSSACIGAKKIDSISFASFEPEECPSEPEDGAYLQIFDATGASVGEMHRVGTTLDDKVPIAALPSGDFLLFADSSIELRSGDGNPLDQVDADDGWFASAAVSCAGPRCAAAADGVVWIVDSTDLESSYPVTADEATYPTTNQTIYPTAAGVACDQNGICLVTWSRISETRMEDVYITEAEGVFARALDLRTGRLGPDVLVIAPVVNGIEDGVHVASTGSGSFVLAGVAGQDIHLQRVNVQ